jgi:hypothetical protein
MKENRFETFLKDVLQLSQEYLLTLRQYHYFKK